jgi:Large-conductance mechanosensitive channel
LAADFSNFFIMLGPPPAGYSGPMTYDALTKAGVPLLAYGNFITVVINFHHPGFHHFLDGPAARVGEEEDRSGLRCCAGAGRRSAAAGNPRCAEEVARRRSAAANGAALTVPSLDARIGRQ